MEAVLATSAAPWPEEVSRKIPGARFATGTVMGALVRSPLVTVTAACVCPNSCQGTLKLICCGGTTNNGAAIPPTRTGAPGAEEPKPLPNTQAMLPGPSGAPTAKL